MDSVSANTRKSITNRLSSPLRLPDIVKRTPINQLNPYLMCALCNGYLIDAVTMVECLHSFCRSCLLNYFKESPMCPLCQQPITKNKLQSSIRSDQTLQDLVYKIVPGLYGSELKRRKQFYLDHCTTGCSATENNSSITSKSNNAKILHIFDKHLVDLASCICSPEEILSFSIEFMSPKGKIKNDNEKALLEDNLKFKRYFRCPAAVKISHLKRLLALKLDLSNNHRIALWYADETQNDDLSLMDIAYIYSWKRKTPLQFYFNVYKLEIEEEVMPELPPQVEVPPPVSPLNEKTKFCTNNDANAIEDKNSADSIIDAIVIRPSTPANQNNISDLSLSVSSNNNCFISPLKTPPPLLVVAPITVKINKTAKKRNKKSLDCVVQNLAVSRVIDARNDEPKQDSNMKLNISSISLLFNNSTPDDYNKPPPAKKPKKQRNSTEVGGGATKIKKKKISASLATIKTNISVQNVNNNNSWNCGQDNDTCESKLLGTVKKNSNNNNNSITTPTSLSLTC